MLQRPQWINLNGSWDFAIDRAGLLTMPQQINWRQKILVPFAPETPASGIADTGFYQAVWYRRSFDLTPISKNQRVILHFGAVDYCATVWVNNQLAVHHEGGYTPFEADITDLLKTNGPQMIVVRAEDDPHDLTKPRGKQDWLLDAHSIWYPRTTGIWQTVWLETIPATHLEYVRWTCSVEDWHIQLDARIAGPQQEGMTLHVKLSAGGKSLITDSYAIGSSQQVSRKITLTDLGIDSGRNALLWWPHAPNLINAELTLRDADGDVIDAVTSYTAMRSASLLGDRFCLNGNPYKLQLVLDQGYWPETGLSAPDDDALRKDVELLKSMGFNGVRKHQKIEDPRFLYWADHLGLVVWEEMPSAYAFGQQTIERVSRQWVEAIHRDVSHPCIVAWVPFNESWGVPNLPTREDQRKFVAGIYGLTRSLDPSRPCIGNDGWEAVANAGDIIGIHDYDADPARIARRYAHDPDNVVHLMKNERPGHKILLLEGYSYQNQPIMLTEFGGIAFSKDTRTWGYSRAGTAQDYAVRYYNLLDAVRGLSLFSGWCYTQFTDTYQEANGLLYMDRTPKFPLGQIAVATRGARNESEHKIEATWKQNARKTPRSLKAKTHKEK